MEATDKITDMYREFQCITISELEKELSETASREKKLFCRAMINLKLQLSQEKVVGERLL